MNTLLTLSLPRVTQQIFLCLTPDDFTRQRETPWEWKGLNQFEFYFLECFMFIRAKYVLQCSRRDDLQNTGFNAAIDNRGIIIVWTFTFEAAGSKAEGSIL